MSRGTESTALRTPSEMPNLLKSKGVTASAEATRGTSEYLLPLLRAASEEEEQWMDGASSEVPADNEPCEAVPRTGRCAWLGLLFLGLGFLCGGILTSVKSTPQPCFPCFLWSCQSFAVQELGSAAALTFCPTALKKAERRRAMVGSSTDQEKVRLPTEELVGVPRVQEGQSRPLPPCTQPAQALEVRFRLRAPSYSSRVHC